MELLKTSMCRVLCGLKFSVPFIVQLPRSAIAGSYGKNMLSFVTESLSYLLKWLYHLAFPPTMSESSCSSTSSPAFDVVSVLNFDHYNRCVVENGVF